MATRDKLEDQLAPYRRVHSGSRWPPPSTWHLTLLFLGAVDPDRVHELVALVDEVAAMTSGPYRARADVGDGRPRHRGGVAWLGLSTGAGQLISIADALAKQCPPTISLGAPPKRTASAHLTVARAVDEALIDDLRTQRHGRLGIEWQIDRINLVRSHLAPSGASYETMHERTL